MRKDSIFIKDGVLHYGKIAQFNPQILDEMNVEYSLNKIDIHRIKQILMYPNKNQIIVQSDNECMINVESEVNMNDFKTTLFTAYPKSITLPTDKIKIQQIKKPLYSIIVILILYLIVSVIDPKHPSASNKAIGAMIDLLRAFATLGPSRLLLIFGTLILIPSLSIFIKLKHLRKATVIRIVY